MALGTVTWVESAPNEGTLKLDRFTVVGPASYTSGGDTGFRAAVRALAAINDNREPLVIVGQADVTGYRCLYNGTTDKFIILIGDANASDAPDVEATGDLHLSTFDIWVLSK